MMRGSSVCWAIRPWGYLSWAFFIGFILEDISIRKIYQTVLDDNLHSALHFFTSFHDRDLMSKLQERIKRKTESCIFLLSSDPIEFWLCMVCTCMGKIMHKMFLHEFDMHVIELLPVCIPSDKNLSVGFISDFWGEACLWNLT